MPANSVLIDIGALSCACTDHALETLSKAMSGEEDGGPDMWAPHDSLFIQSVIELFSSRGLLRLDKVKAELNAWSTGKHYQGNGTIPPKPNTSALHWTPDEMALVRIYLQNLPPGSLTLSDWGLLVDYLVHRYMPVGDLATEAEWLAVRSTLMGKVQASLDGKLDVPQADAVVSKLPLTIQEAQQAFYWDDQAPIKHILDYAYLRGTENLVQLSENVRHKLKQTILAYQEQVLTGQSPPKESLQTQLFDAFGVFNRDWRRIAVTEVGENANQGLIASLPPNTRVRRMEQYRGACPFCKKINGRILTVVDPKQKNKDGENQVWVGKNNIGRSGSPKKKGENGLIERSAAERWWIPAGVVHPHCRGMWTVMENAIPGADPHFQAWLEKHLSRINPKPDRSLTP